MANSALSSRPWAGAALLLLALLAIAPSPATATDPYAGLSCPEAIGKMFAILQTPAPQGGRTGFTGSYQYQLGLTIPSHLGFVGDFQTCSTLSGMKYCTFDSQYKPNPFTTRTATTSICIPSNCAADTALVMLGQLVNGLAPGGASLTTVGARCYNTHPDNITGPGPIFAVVVFSLIAGWIVLGSFLSLRGYVLPSELATAGEGKRTFGGPAALLANMMLHFSLARTWPAFCRPPNHPVRLRMLDGLKVLSMVWVIFGHTIVWNQGSASSEATIRLLTTDQQQWYWSFIFNAYAAVDTFLFTSGFLAVHFVIRATSKLAQKAAADKAAELAADSDNGSLDNGKGKGKGGDDTELTYTMQPLGNTRVHIIDIDGLLMETSTDDLDEEVGSSGKAMRSDPGSKSSMASLGEKTAATAASPPQSRSSSVVAKTLLAYLHRWLRLTPLYGLVILFLVNLVQYLDYGTPYKAINEGMANYESCTDYWWTNMLYINNLYPWQFEFRGNGGPMCMPWTWYLAIEFQLFILAVPIGLLFLSHRRLCYAATIVLLIATLIIRAVMVFWYNTGVCGFSPPSWFQVSYTKMWTRGIPYYSGMLLAMLYHDEVRFLRNAGFYKRLAFNAVACGLLLTSVLVISDEMQATGLDIATCRWSADEGNAYESFYPLLWSTGLFMLCWGMIQGWKTWINSFLSWHGFVFCSRLIYGAYLIHPIIIAVSADSIGTKVNFSGKSAFVDMVGYTVITFLVAIILFVGVEMPIMTLSKSFLGWVSGSGSANARR